MKDRIDLVAAASALMGPPEGRSGANGAWWRCRFHDDRNPSLRVDPEKRRWKCFGCGAGGDAAALVMRLDPALRFADAVRRLAAMVGPEGPEGQGRRPSEGGQAPSEYPRSQSPLRRPPSGLAPGDAAAAAESAARALWTPRGGEGLGYLRDRGLIDPTIRAARLRSTWPRTQGR